MEKALRGKLSNGKFSGVTLSRSKAMRAVKGSGNKSTELKFCRALVETGIGGWEAQKKIIGNPDIFFPAYKVAVFLDGCFWHGCPKCGHIPITNNAYWRAKIERTIERDRSKAKALEEQGYLVVRFWEHELNDNIGRCVELMKDFIEERLIVLSNQMD